MVSVCICHSEKGVSIGIVVVYIGYITHLGEPGVLLPLSAAAYAVGAEEPPITTCTSDRQPETTLPTMLFRRWKRFSLPATYLHIQCIPCT